jgi:ubiquinone/menaquinone biosynthesis C-methylase UbiE
MPKENKPGALQVSRQNNVYYNAIAPDYDRILEKDEVNFIVRQKVAAEFSKIVRKGRVLDFGGGTGLDIGWMSQNHYHISFCEPSHAMRKIAMVKAQKNHPSAVVTFFDESKTDFRTWDDSFPFEFKVHAILANFGVLNCIKDIELVFGKMALALQSEGNFFALILNSSLKNRLRSNTRGTLQSIFSNRTVTSYVDYNGKRQLIYLHSLKEMSCAFNPYFELISTSHFEVFTMIRLKRK